MNRRKFLKATAVTTVAGVSCGSVVSAAVVDSECKTSAIGIWLRVCKTRIANAVYPFKSSYPGVIKLLCPDPEFQDWVDNWQESTVEDCWSMYQLRRKEWQLVGSWSLTVPGHERSFEEYRNCACLSALLAVYDLKVAARSKEREAAWRLANTLTGVDSIREMTNAAISLVEKEIKNENTEL